MKHISPSKLFKDQLVVIGEKKALKVLANFLPTEKMFKQSLRHINITKLSIIVKVKDSSYSIKYTYDKKGQQLIAEKILLFRQY